MQRSTNKAIRERFFMSTVFQHAGTSLSARIDALTLKQFNFIDTMFYYKLLISTSVQLSIIYLCKLHLLKSC